MDEQKSPIELETVFEMLRRAIEDAENNLSDIAKRNKLSDFCVTGWSEGERFFERFKATEDGAAERGNKLAFDWASGRRQRQIDWAVYRDRAGRQEPLFTGGGYLDY